jgi:hypothetical protein
MNKILTRRPAFIFGILQEKRKVQNSPDGSAVMALLACWHFTQVT